MFDDRKDAGRKLAHALSQYAGRKDAVVVALPRGGVVVGYEVAKELHLPLDVIVPRKIGHPGNPEYAIGAIAEDGKLFCNENEARIVPVAWIKEEIVRQKEEIKRRLEMFRKGMPTRDFSVKTALIVDDGVATGYTMQAAISDAKRLGAVRVVVAVPHGATDSLGKLSEYVDEVVALERPPFYTAVGAYYGKFPQIEDETVIRLLQSRNAETKF